MANQDQLAQFALGTADHHTTGGVPNGLQNGGHFLQDGGQTLEQILVQTTHSQRAVAESREVAKPVLTEFRNEAESRQASGGEERPQSQTQFRHPAAVALSSVPRSRANSMVMVRKKQFEQQSAAPPPLAVKKGSSGRDRAASVGNGGNVARLR